MSATKDPATFKLTGRPGRDWRDAVAALGNEHGFFEPLGPGHSAVFLDRGDTLLVSFESEFGIQTLSPSATPLSFDVAQETGWSVLTVLCTGNTWYRDVSVQDFFDQLREDGFLQDFKRVIFFGAGPGGYAAGAYSAALPGARVVMIQPQATLSPDLTGWDDRFRDMRRLDFSGRYSYAPEMVKDAAAAHVIFDPRVPQDAMHAALFAGPNVKMHRMPFMGDMLIQDLITLKAMPYILHAAAHDRLTTHSFAKLARLRRKYVPYLRRLLAHLERSERYDLAARLCRNQVATRDAPYFARRLAIAEKRLRGE
ncbi:phosphoadenosine phosphosulfate reductase [Pseudoprimorskyibacter insulae]|uniref:Phosphoadenosine phosphosulfate reductase n=1 Tax=Pseudoprimorskyibacter insulae TaxID=1695997 RepID=A0A2R8AWX3_9RHOB|nr:phosphoadenosine phosphosulfate reductase [Pseudoprimorskyibacter insulae]SPF80498.1 hypothetical protein PRI8871_02308 [Pseudoprimorskyibacter insulae]